MPACQSLDCVSVFALSLRRRRRRAEGHRPSRRRRRRSARTSASACWAPRMPSSSATTAYAALYAQAIGRLKAMGGTPVEIDYAPFRDAAELLYSGPWVAERTAAVGAFIEGAARGRHLAGHAPDHPARPHVQRRRCLRGPVRARRLSRRAPRPRWQDLDFLTLPTARHDLSRGRLEREPMLYNITSRPLHQLREFLRPLGPRFAGGLPARRPAVRHHPDRPTACRARPAGLRRALAARRCRCRSARPRAICRRPPAIRWSPRIACRSPWSARI